MDYSMLNEAERAHIQRLIEQKQIRDVMRFYSGLVERCFNDCVNDFTSKVLNSKESLWNDNIDPIYRRRVFFAALKSSSNITNELDNGGPK
ncbi:4116_t:CDS:2 [Paraglomus occultum]|uniref:Mitochondrial import inner membrane translocase subunit n=1 Tax=Paraglomus occultum TaxID=144539 RepID=A0A9N9ABL2_9GLOM|nr:4116_t:CDS:2 [Paraglomus occultum]